MLGDLSQNVRRPYMASNNPAAPNGDILPPAPDFHTILETIAVALSKLPGADGMMIGRAQAALESNYAKGFRTGAELGRRDGYQVGYQEGVEDGHREALDKAARELADTAILQAAARAGVTR
jgi:flagellar biosynthesis/type III secretory pathway protein FliH